MTYFRNRLINELAPKTVNLLIILIIPPKGVKTGKESEGSKLFDVEKTDESGSVCDKNYEEDVHSELLLKSLDWVIPIERMKQEQK